MPAAIGYSSLDDDSSHRGAEESGLLAAKTAAPSPPSSSFSALRSKIGPVTLVLAAVYIVFLGTAGSRGSAAAPPQLQASAGGGIFGNFVDSVLEEYTAEVDALEEKVSAQGKAIGDLNDAVAALKQTTATLPSLAQLRAAEASLKEEVDGEIQDALDQIADLESDVEGAASAAEKEGSALEALRGEVEGLKKENEVLKKMLVGEESTIDFEDASGTSTYAYIPDGYKGLDWDNFMVQAKSYETGTGFELGTTSGNYVAYNKYGNPCTVSSTFPFSVAGFDATAGYKAGMDLKVEGVGRFGKASVYETVLGDPNDGPVYVNLGGKGFENILELKITTSGGTPVFSGHSSYSYVAIDDMVVY